MNEGWKAAMARATDHRQTRMAEVHVGVPGQSYAIVVPHDATAEGTPVDRQSPATVRYSYRGVRVTREDLVVLLTLEALERAGLP